MRRKFGLHHWPRRFPAAMPGPIQQERVSRSVFLFDPQLNLLSNGFRSFAAFEEYGLVFAFRRHQVDVAGVRHQIAIRCGLVGSFFKKHPKITHVYFNGQKAAGLFDKKVMPKLTGNYEYSTLPSTSPAYAAKNYAAKLADWSVIDRGDPTRIRSPGY